LKNFFFLVAIKLTQKKIDFLKIKKNLLKKKIKKKKSKKKKKKPLE